MDARRGSVELAGATVSFLEWRPSEETGIPVVLLHGGGADSAQLSWGELGPALSAAGHRVIAPDLPGFGRSEAAARPATQEALVRVVSEVIDALDLRSYVIGGLSLGGGLTIGHLLDRPGYAIGAVLLGSYGLMPRLGDGPLGGVGHLGVFLMLRTGLLAAMTSSYARNPAAMERGLRDVVRNPASRTPALIEEVCAEAATGRGLRTFGEWQRDQVLWNRLRTAYASRLSAITVPVLLVHGDHDSGVPITHARHAVEELPRGELLEVADAGHWVQRDQSSIVIPAVLEFLKRIADAAAADS